MNIDYKLFTQILKEELVPALGCTEPIAIAYLASYARDVLGTRPEKIVIEVSGNVLKNVKSVIVPNTDQLKGIQAACAVGIVCGITEKQLEVISQVQPSQQQEIKNCLQTCPIEIKASTSPHIFDLFLHAYADENECHVRILHYHTNIVYVEKNGIVLKDENTDIIQEDVCDKSSLTIEKIVEYAKTVNLEDVKPTLDRQIEYNMAIANEGLKHSYGCNIGSILLEHNPNDIVTKMKAYAAAGSDARMNGCEMPVIIVSGSGNQGMTASIPVIVYAREKGYSQEQLYRALLVSNLVTIHQKSGIGRLSAFCGAVSAGVGSGAGIAFLETQSYHAVAHTMVNALAIISGMVCDGAKASCAAKIQAAVDAGWMGYLMYTNKKEFKDGDGLIVKGVENTIDNIANLAKEGMKETDKEIIKMMINRC